MSFVLLSGVYLFFFLVLSGLEIQNRLDGVAPVAPGLWSAGFVISVIMGVMGIIPYLRCQYGWMDGIFFFAHPHILEHPRQRDFQSTNLSFGGF